MMRGGVWVGAERGFSLIELIGVLAVMGILASMTVPPILRQIRQAQSGNEEANLNEVARAIVEGIKATGTIPNPNVVANDLAGWFTLAQPYTALSENAFLNVFPENPSTERRYYLDPAFDAYLAGTYTTPPAGFPTAGFPVGALRILIVSSSRGISNPADAAVDPVLPGNAGANLTQLDQLALRNWNKVFAGGVVSVPLLPNNPFSALWTGKGEYLHVKTVDLRPLFCKVTLIDTAAPEDIGLFNVAVQGSGYPPSSTISVQLAGNTLSFTTTPPDTFVDVDGDLKFTADPPDTLNDNNANGTYEVDGTIRLGGKPSFSQIAVYNVRRVAPIPNTVIPPGTAEYEGPASPPNPSYDLIRNVGPGAGGFLVDQTQTFYVLKGQSINLFDGANALNRSVIIQSDVQYKYFNNSWNQVD
jgi:prepilin-type N-terminal cleavage/methylation domain-containing protein